MSKSPKNHDPEKLLELFKKSKKVVSTFVDQFQIKNGRKPHGEDLASAPEYVRVCIKNCKRIKAHLEKSPEAVTEQEPKKPSSPKTKHIPVQKTKTSLMENLENSMSQPAPAKTSKQKSKVWGAHLNRSISDITNNSTDKRNYRNSELKTTSYSGKYF